MANHATAENIDTFIQDIFRRATKNIRLELLTTPSDIFVLCFKKNDQRAALAGKSTFGDSLMAEFKKAAEADNVIVQETVDEKGKQLVSLNKSNAM